MAQQFDMGHPKKTVAKAAPDATTNNASPNKRGLVPCRQTDYLRADPERRGQKFVVLSVLNPEDTLADRRVFEFGRFVRSIAADVGALLDTLVERAGDLADTRSTVSDSVRMIRERYAYMWDDAAMQDEMRVFCRANADRITADFDKDHDFATSVRGINVRGVCETQQEAAAMVEQLKVTDTTHSMYTGNVGYWLPLAVHPEDIGDSEYAESQLNTLMKKYTELQADNEVRYELRKTHLQGRVAANNASMQQEAAQQKAAETQGDALQGAEDLWMASRGSVTSGGHPAPGHE